METGTIIALVILASASLLITGVVALLWRRHTMSVVWSKIPQTASQYAAASSPLAPRKVRTPHARRFELNEGQREAYVARWTEVESSFVSSPRQALKTADALLQEAMAARGYPVADFEQRAADLSLEHADLVADYRAAHKVALKADSATSEEMGMALLHYRALSRELLKKDEPAFV